MKTAKKIRITLVIVLIAALGVALAAGAAAWVIRDQLDRQRYLKTKEMIHNVSKLAGILTRLTMPK